MKERIGMLIWKEMNRQGLSHGNFVRKMRDKNVFLKDFFKMETIDVKSLIQISAVLKTNFFQFYEPEDLVTLLTVPDKDNKATSINEMIKTQHKLLLAHKKIIMEQDRLIVQLSEHYSDE